MRLLSPKPEAQKKTRPNKSGTGTKPKQDGVFGLTTLDAIFRIIKDEGDELEVSKGHFKDGVWVDVKIFRIGKWAIKTILSEPAAKSLMRQRQKRYAQKKGEN